MGEEKLSRIKDSTKTEVSVEVLPNLAYKDSETRKLTSQDSANSIAEIQLHHPIENKENSVNSIIQARNNNYIVLRSSANITIPTHQNFMEIPCNLNENLQIGQKAVYLESETLVKKGLLIRPAVFDRQEENVVRAVNVSHRFFKLTKGQRLGQCLLLRE